MGREFISVRPTQGRQGISVSKAVYHVPKILPDLYKENVRQSLLGTSRWAMKVKSIVMGGVLLALRSSYSLGEGMVPIWGCFAHGIFCLR